MGWINMIFGACALHNVATAYVNVINTTANFVEPTTPINLITNKTILTQYSIMQGLKIFGKKAKLQCKNNCNNFTTSDLSNQISLADSLMNNTIIVIAVMFVYCFKVRIYIQ